MIQCIFRQPDIKQNPRLNANSTTIMVFSCHEADDGYNKKHKEGRDEKQ